MKVGIKKNLNTTKKLVESKQQSAKKKKRKRKITWWNPPFCLTVKTPIGRKFRNLIKTHFKKDIPQ